MALLGSHAFATCDSICAFPGNCKVKPLKMHEKEQALPANVSEPGEKRSVSEGLIVQLQTLVCVLYGEKGTFEATEFRYEV